LEQGAGGVATQRWLSTGIVLAVAGAVQEDAESLSCRMVERLTGVKLELNGIRPVASRSMPYKGGSGGF